MTEQFSTEAQVVAGSIWTKMPMSSTEVKFDRPWVIHPRMREGLDELTEAGLLTCEALNHLPDSPLIWKPTERMKTEGPRPTWDFLKRNSFPFKQDEGSEDE